MAVGSRQFTFLFWFIFPCQTHTIRLVLVTNVALDLWMIQRRLDQMFRSVKRESLVSFHLALEAAASITRRMQWKGKHT